MTLERRKVPENESWKVIVFDATGQKTAEFVAHPNLNLDTNACFPFDIEFDGEQFDEIMSRVLLKVDEVQRWLQNPAANRIIYL